jgi:hypothetical protein
VRWPFTGYAGLVAAPSMNLATTATGLYAYTWKTEKAWAKRCVQPGVQLIDGSAHTALFQFK